jgi:Reverse transcriptase (RNA-dependent DNA polymerase)
VNNVNREIKRETSLLSKHSWNDKLASLQIDDCSLFQFAKTIKKKFKPISPLKNTKDELAFSDKEKASLIAASFLKAHQISMLPTSHSLAVENSAREIQLSDVNFPDTDITSLHEVKSFISCL